MVRGNDRRDIFTTEEDRARFCALLAEGLERFGHRVHAFCLMTNHVHLAVQVEDAPLSAIMQALAGRYTQWFNRRHGRVGHLFQGRYKALMVEAESYLFALIGYIHRNPLEAGLVRRAREYPWSSHPSYLGLASSCRRTCARRGDSWMPWSSGANRVISSPRSGTGWCWAARSLRRRS
jgi:REP element-mobilizing transposase RayT